MTLEPRISSIVERLRSLGDDLNAERICAQIEFANGLIELYPSYESEWKRLMDEALSLVESADDGSLAEIVSRFEEILSPIGEVAKQYVVHCVGHAHIDMDWSWPWVETAAICHDTFTTVNKLMEEYPDFKYSQSQISIYQLLEKYYPELFETVRRRVREGRWEVVAGAWVEGDKNLSSGESLCRHILYAKRWLREHMGLAYDAVKIDWQCDTFGHAHTVPAILSSGGITRYYHCRTGPEKWLLRWKSPDGSSVIRFLDKQWYGGHVAPKVASYLLDFAKETGLKELLFVYGVGDHGGGPTRLDLAAIVRMNGWPIYPRFKFSTTDEFFSAVEQFRDEIPEYDGELNTIFEGCYTSQSKAKLVNRLGEAMLTEAEIASVVAGAAVGFEYPVENLRRAWERVLFNQFHDILGGSSEHEAMEEAVARFREAEAEAGAVMTRAFRRIAAAVDTLSVSPKTSSVGDGASLGYGAGDLPKTGLISTFSFGEKDVEPVIVFNTLPFSRSEVVETKIWGRDWQADKIVFMDDSGRTVQGQVVGRSSYGGQEAVSVVFPANDVPAVGYKTFFAHAAGVAPVPSGEVRMSVGLGDTRIIENEHLRVEIDTKSGAIKSITDSEGRDYVPPGEMTAVLEYFVEEPHNMSSWEIGRISKLERLTSGAAIDTDEVHPFHEGSEGLGMVRHWTHQQVGPNRAAVRTTRLVSSSRIITEIALSAGSRLVEICLTVHWKEMGSPSLGVPGIRMAFPVNVSEPEAVYEIPFGSIKRPCDGREVPALRWADLSGVSADGELCGVMFINNCKHGHSADGNTLRITLIRSSYDPDPVPEIGTHHIRLAIAPHAGGWRQSSAARIAAAFDQPMKVLNSDLHNGSLAPKAEFCRIITPNIQLAALKRAEDEDALIIRLYETDGLDTEAEVCLSGLAASGCEVLETDTLEIPRLPLSARMEGDILKVEVPAYGFRTVMVKGWKKP